MTIRRIDPLYVVAVVLLLVLVGLAIVVATSTQSRGRSGSVLDTGGGGASDLRALVEKLGARTVLLQGDRFAPREVGPSVVFLLGATEFMSDEDVASIRTYLQGGGTLILATDAGFAEARLLQAFGASLVRSVASGQFEATSVVAATARARHIYMDRGSALEVGDRWSPVVRSGTRTIAAMTREGRGTLFVVASLAPFVNSLLATDDNARFAVALAAAGFGSGRTIGFDEFHHGSHPSSDLLAVLERTWLGRALLAAAALAFVYLLWSGRRFGPPLPADPRPPRSSLEYVRGFAGLVRRSGRDEIVRERLRRELRQGLGLRYGLDASAPFDRMLASLDADDPESARAARSLDESLRRRLRDADLLRTVARIEELTRKREAE